MLFPLKIPPVHQCTCLILLNWRNSSVAAVNLYYMYVPFLPIGGTPTVQELRIICHYILRGQSQGLDWRQIPLQLGIVGDKVQLAVEAFPNEPSRAIYTALDYWRNGQGLQQPTWTSLLRALVNANFQNVAMAIEDKLKKGEPLQ